LTTHASKETWVVIMDGAHARFFVLDRADGFTLHPKESFDGSDRPTRELTSDRPGRSYASVGTARSAMEPRTTAQEHAEKTFVHKVADRLRAAGEEKLFDEVVIVADPKSLGEIRKDLDTHFRDRYVALEVAKDWLKLNPPDMARHLRQHFRRAGLH